MMFPPTANTTFDDLSQAIPTTCPAINGFRGALSRRFCTTAAGANFLVYQMVLNDPYNGNCSTFNAGNTYGFESVNYTNHPYVQLAKAVNQITHAAPARLRSLPADYPLDPLGPFNHVADLIWSLMQAASHMRTTAIYLEAQA